MITVFIIFTGLLLINVLTIFYTQKQLKRQPAVFRIRVQPTEEEIFTHLQQLSKIQSKQSVNWNDEGF